MVSGLRASQLLEGVRGASPVCLPWGSGLRSWRFRTRLVEGLSVEGSETLGFGLGVWRMEV